MADTPLNEKEFVKKITQFVPIFKDDAQILFMHFSKEIQKEPDQ
jgi:hypothetical protein